MKGHGFSRAIEPPGQIAALAVEGMHVVEKKPPQRLKLDFPICASRGAAQVMPIQCRQYRTTAKSIGHHCANLAYVE
jgi:hypothetical protein